jgi:hypothetical protein
VPCSLSHSRNGNRTDIASEHDDSIPLHMCCLTSNMIVLREILNKLDFVFLISIFFTGSLHTNTTFN